MAGNSNEIKKRIGTIGTIQKITNAMKLVSLSKLQRFRRYVNELEAFMKGIDSVPSRPVENSDQPVVLICMASDLGLASAFNKGLADLVIQEQPDAVFWLGTQYYERIERRFKILNEKVQGETLDKSLYFKEIIDQVIGNYQIKVAMPNYNAADNSLNYTAELLERELVEQFDTVYEPNFAEVNQRFREEIMLMSLYHAYYDAKFAEYTIRRIAMEQATDNAEDMIEDLNLEFNRIRQEKITQEIAELMGGIG